MANLNSARGKGWKDRYEEDDEDQDYFVCSLCGAPLIIRGGTRLECTDPDCQ